MSEVFSFAEETCWSKDQFRQARKEVVFAVTSTGKIQGKRLQHSLVADYAIFYDPEDHYLIERLSDMEPEINWNSLVYVRKIDMSGLDIIDPDVDRVVGKISIRKSRRIPNRNDLSGEPGERVVISLSEFRLAREKQDAA